MNDTIVINKQFFDEMHKNLKDLAKYFQKPESPEQENALSDAAFTLYMLESDDIVSSMVEYLTHQDFVYYKDKDMFDAEWADSAKIMDIEVPDRFPCMGKCVRYIENPYGRNEIAMTYIYECED